MPLLEFTLPDHMEDVQQRLEELLTYDWIILTSQNGVDFFFKLLGNQPLKLPKIAVIGSKTEAALKRHGYKADFVPVQFVAEGFVAEFNTRLDPGHACCWQKEISQGQSLRRRSMKLVHLVMK